MSRSPPRGRLKARALVSLRVLNSPATLSNRGGWFCFKEHRLHALHSMTTIQPLQTWEVLKDLAFMPNPGVWSDILPGLSFDFGNLLLSAGAVTTGWKLTPVILFTGIIQGDNSLAEVRFEMPRTIENLDVCAAWIAWHLDQCCTGNFQPIRNAEWLAIGRSNKLFLPWVIDTEAYERRPHCAVEREWARMMIKTLKAGLCNLTDDEAVSFEFDGNCCVSDVEVV